MKNVLVVLAREKEAYKSRLSNMQLPEVVIHVPENDAQIRDILPKADILLAEPPIATNYINLAINLKWMQSTFTGIDAMKKPGLKRNYHITNVRDLYGDVMAEYVFAYILMFEREILEIRERQFKKIWLEKPYESLMNKTIGIMGTGSIGKRIAALAKAVNMQTAGYRYNDEPLANFDTMYTPDTLSAFLTNSKYIVNVLPITTHTKHLLDNKAFESMHPSTILFNIGRGATICEESLINALKAKKIKAAVLDVFEKEPLQTDNPLWEMENVFVTPHISGYCLSDCIFNTFEDNYRRFISNEFLINQIDFEREY